MNKKPIFLAMLVVLLALSLALVACDSGDGGNPTPTPTPTPTPQATRGSIKIDNTSVLILYWAGVFDRDWNKLYETRTGETILQDGSKTFSEISPGWYNVSVTDEFYDVYRTSTMVEVIAGQTVNLRFDGRQLR